MDTSAVTGTDMSSVTGDERGGKLPYAEGKVSAAVKVMQAYCTQFGTRVVRLGLSAAERWLSSFSRYRRSARF